MSEMWPGAVTLAARPRRVNSPGRRSRFMSEYSTPVKTRQQPGIGATEPSDLLPIPPAALARRRRLVRLAGLLTLVGGLGLSTIPGPKTGRQTQITETERGVTTVVHKFSYHRLYGVPFPVANAEFDEAGEIRRFGMDDEQILGVFGNMAVAFGIVMVGSLLFGLRRRREP